jgi:SNF2 family DNA or RNA helicase
LTVYDRPTEPLTTQCGHVFCAECILNYLECATQDQTTCPNCRAEISRDKLIPLKSVAEYFRGDDVYVEEAKSESEDADSVETSNKMFMSTKMKRVLELLDESKKSGEKTIVFCSFAKMLNLLEKPLNAANHKFVRVRIHFSD